MIAAVERIIKAEALASGAEREPAILYSSTGSVLVNDPLATERTVTAFTEHFGAGELLPLPQLASSEDGGNLALAAGVPTVYWFWGGPDRDRVLTASAEGRFDQDIPSNHSPEFAPEIEPTIRTGVEALTIAALTWLE